MPGCPTGPHNSKRAIRSMAPGPYSDKRGRYVNDKPIQITGQCVDIKRLKATGGWRFSVDLFDALEKDILLATSLVNRQQVVTLTIEPEENEQTEKQESKRGRKTAKGTAPQTYAETTEVRKRIPR